MNNNSLHSYNLYYKKINKCDIVSDKLIKLYIKSYQIYKDNAMLNRIVDSNQRYIASIAYKFSSDMHYIIDLVNEGNIGLIEAVKKFNVENNNSFLTYATFYIRKSIIDYMYKYSNDTHIPFTIINNSYKIFNFIDKYYVTYKIDPTIEQISKETKLDKQKIVNILNYKFNLKQKSSLSYIEPDNISDSKLNFIDDISYLINDNEKELLFDIYGIDTVKLTRIELEKKYNLSYKKINKQVVNLIKKLKKEL